MNQPTGELSKIRALHRQQFDRVESEGSTPLEHPPGISTTESLDILKIEAQMQADGKELYNPHMPLNKQTLLEARKMLQDEDLEPAWKNG